MRGAIAVTAAAWLSAGCTPTVQDAVARRDAHMQGNIGETRYFSRTGFASICATPEATGRPYSDNSCRRPTSGAVKIVDVPAVSASILPVYEVAVDGAKAYMKHSDWLSLDTDHARKAEAAAKADCDRRGGVSIGMTSKQVLASCWGKPQRVNRTITAGMDHEQWVYPGYNYVYVRNGIVTSIQTSNR